MKNLISATGMDGVPLLPVAVKLLPAIFCGGVLGVEATWKRRAAGARTCSMVCLGAAVAMMTGQAMARHGGWGPARMGAQVASGIGFIGAGAILITGCHEIKGLTPAAGMGLAARAGCCAAARMACAVLFGVVFFGGRVQDRVMPSTRRVRLSGIFENADAMTGFWVLARQRHIAVGDMEPMPGIGPGRGGFSLTLPRGMGRQAAADLFAGCAGVVHLEPIWPAAGAIRPKTTKSTPGAAAPPGDFM